MFHQDISAFARARLDLARMERLRFRLAPQISLEILLILGAARHAVPLLEIHERIAAADKSIRIHLRALMQSGLVAEEEVSGDRRTKRLRLTERGQADLAAYVDDSRRMSDAARIEREVRETFLSAAEK